MSPDEQQQTTIKNILIVDDEEGIRKGLQRLFEKNGFTVYTADLPEQAEIILGEILIHAALLDIRLKGGDSGIELLKKIREIDPDIAVIMITGYGTIESAVECMKYGASDYILKPLNNILILDTVRKSLELSDLIRENSFLKETISRESGSFITENPRMHEIIQKADKVKNSKASILITGESGTGKEVLSRYIHSSSNRNSREIVCLNCAALSETLLLSELFGHEKGAFTGAVQKKSGKFEIADNGTLFLDEVGDMSLEVQAKLLRALEDNSFERLGGTKQIHTNVRFIAATNCDLEELIEQKLFRSDLYYRINVVHFHLPPLRERKEDILPLAMHFIHVFNSDYGKKVERISKDAAELLTSYNWPGNIRELKNVINQGVLFAESESLDKNSLQNTLLKTAGDSFAEIDLDSISSLKDAVESVSADYERRLIQKVLQKYNYNKTHSSDFLQVTRKTLIEKIKKYGLDSGGEKL